MLCLLSSKKRPACPRSIQTHVVINHSISAAQECILSFSFAGINVFRGNLVDLTRSSASTHTSSRKSPLDS